MTFIDRRVKISDLIQMVTILGAGIYVVIQIQFTTQSLQGAIERLTITVDKLGNEFGAIKDRVTILETTSRYREAK